MDISRKLCVLCVFVVIYFLFSHDSLKLAQEAFSKVGGEYANSEFAAPSLEKSNSMKRLIELQKSTGTGQSPEQVAEKIETYRALGCTGFVPWCADYPSDQSLRLFATEVMPGFR